MFALFNFLFLKMFSKTSILSSLQLRIDLIQGHRWPDPIWEGSLSSIAHACVRMRHRRAHFGVNIGAFCYFSGIFSLCVYPLLLHHGLGRGVAWG